MWFIFLLNHLPYPIKMNPIFKKYLQNLSEVAFYLLFVSVALLNV